MNIKLSLIASALALTPFLANAADLNQVYNEALKNDPTFAKNHADWLNAQEGLTLAKTGNGTPGSGLFPNIDFTAGINENYAGINGSPMHGYHSNSYQIAVTQPIFNMATWESISAASYSVKAATATYMAAGQDLMTTSVKDYFEVLRAKAALQSNQSEKKMVAQQLKQAKARQKVGISPATDTYDAQAKYDQIIAAEIKDKNQVQDALGNLNAITGSTDKNIQDLKKTIPFSIVNPNNTKGWVTTALKQNYQIKSGEYSVLASHKNITIAEVAKVPTINLVGSYGGVSNPSGPDMQTGEKIKSSNATVGLNLNFPVFRGGYDFVNVKQKRYQYLSDADQLHATEISIANNTRQAVLTVKSGENQIKADLQSVKAAAETLKANQNSYVMGVESMSDVLRSVSDLADQKLQYANDRYDYMEHIIDLKELTGTLSPADINTMNSLLEKSKSA